jgi:nucleotide-binding universal stress UspA family protein
MYHSILVAQDASDNSERALELAIWLAVDTRAHITLLHLHHRKILPAEPVSTGQMEQRLRDWAEVCRGAGIRCTHRVVEGWTNEALIRESQWYDLIVAGKHGEGRSLRSHGLGSLPSALLASSPVPVLISDDKPVAPESLLVIFDETPDASRALRMAADLALAREIRLHVIEAIPGDRQPDQLKRASEYLRDCPGLVADVKRIDDKPVEGVLRYIQDRDIHFTVMPALDRSLFGHKFTSRVAEETRSSLIVPKGRTPPVY